MKKIIDYLKSKVSLSNYTTEELEYELMNRYKDYDTIIDKKVEEKMFKELRNIEGFRDYLGELSSKDILRYFQAINDPQRDQTKGAFNRTVYLKGKLVDSEKIKLLNNSRYSK